VDRRKFLSTGAACAAFSWNAAGTVSLSRASTAAPEASKPFTLNYGPHFGMFRHLGGKKLEGQLAFAAEQGFRGWEDNGMKGRPVAEQKRLAATMERIGIQLGVISALRGVWNKVNFAGGDEASREEILSALRDSIEVAKRVNTRYLTCVLGMANPKLEPAYQTAAAIELLKRCCDIVGPHELVMVLEPLNTKVNHPGVFLSRSDHAYEICRAVDHPSCKIVFDVYHQQITEGNLIPNIDRCWDEIAYFQTGDNPGRNEPGTGEINYANVLQHIYAKGYGGFVGLEHGNSRRGGDGERAVIEAYRRVDPQPES
jgi:hydroxypyruvate isomerase